MYYNINIEQEHLRVMSPSEVAYLGIPSEDLESIGIYKLTKEIDDIDQDLQVISSYYVTGSKESGFKLISNCVYKQPDAVKLVLKDRLKIVRKGIEEGGILIQDTNTKLDSTRIDGQMIHNAYIGSKYLNQNVVIDFLSSSGWISITSEILAHLFSIYAKHVEMCFTREREISELIDSAITAEEALNTYNVEKEIGWPNYDN